MARFDTTRWSIVLQARDATPATAPALAMLCRTYRPPVLAYIRRRGYAPDQAEDLTQTFFTHFIERAWHAGADPARGRFRAYLLTAVKRFLIDRDIEAHRLKRGGGVHFDDITAEPSLDLASDETPDAAFDRDWAIAVVDAAMIAAVEKAILASDLGLTPTTVGQVIRINLPPLTEERRKELSKHVAHEGENAKIAVRNVRRDALHQVKELLKDKKISEDEERRAEEEIQKFTDKFVRDVDGVVKAKEDELMAM